MIAPEQVSIPSTHEWTGAGTGWSAYGEILRAAIAPAELLEQLNDCLPAAASIAKLAAVDYRAGRRVDAAQAVPVYLRDNVAKKSVR